MSEFKNRDIWVFIETDEGKVKSVGLELLNPGRMLADKAGEELVAVILGRDNEEAVAQVRQYGADRIIIYIRHGRAGPNLWAVRRPDRRHQQWQGFWTAPVLQAAHRADRGLYQPGL